MFTIKHFDKPPRGHLNSGWAVCCNGHPFLWVANKAQAYEFFTAH